MQCGDRKLVSKARKSLHESLAIREKKVRDGSVFSSSAL
jgi:hypothetical protein